jgi:preprotein translocase subunit SecD
MYLILLVLLISSNTEYPERSRFPFENNFGHQNIDSTLQSGWYYVSENETGYKKKLDKTEEIYFIDPTPIIKPKNIKKVEFYLTRQDKPALKMTFDKRGTKAWSAATRKAYITKLKLAFIVDDQLLQVSSMESEITGGVAALNRSVHSKNELEQIKKILDKEK